MDDKFIGDPEFDRAFRDQRMSANQTVSECALQLAKALEEQSLVVPGLAAAKAMTDAAAFLRQHYGINQKSNR